VFNTSFEGKKKKEKSPGYLARFVDERVEEWKGRKAKERRPKGFNTAV